MSDTDAPIGNGGDRRRALDRSGAARPRRPPVLRDPSDEHRASTPLELFFDLCFVLAVAALARDLHHDPTFVGGLRFVALFVPVWWAWMGFT